MEAKLTFCRNMELTSCKPTVGLIENIRIDLYAETEEDKKNLDLLCQTGVVATSASSVGKVLSTVLYIPAKKEVV